MTKKFTEQAKAASPKGKATIRTLQLNKETIRDLTPSKKDAAVVRGGAPASAMCGGGDGRCSGKQSGCN